MLQWNSNFGCGSSFVHVCVQDAPLTKATAPSVRSPHVAGLERCGQTRGVSAVSCQVRSHKYTVYINPYHGVCDPFGTISNPSFSGFRRGDAELICHPVWHILESQMFTRLVPEGENALTSRSSNVSFRSICDIWKCFKQRLFRCHFGAIWIIYQECSKRCFQWRFVNRLTLQFSRKAEMYQMDF